MCIIWYFLCDISFFHVFSICICFCIWSKYKTMNISWSGYSTTEKLPSEQMNAFDECLGQVTRQINSRKVLQLGYFGFATNGVKTGAHLAAHHIPAHSQCGRHFWNTQIFIILWKEKTKIHLDRHDVICQRIAWGSCWWRRRRGWRRGRTLSGREAAPGSPRQTSLPQVLSPSFSQVLSPKFYPSFISQANIPATTFTLASSTCFSPGLSVFSLMILFTTDGVATCCTKKDFRNRISGMRFQGWDFRNLISGMRFQKKDFRGKISGIRFLK